MIFLSRTHVIWFFFIMIAIAIAQFYFNRTQILSMRVSDNLDVVNNAAYTFVNLIPFLFLLKERKIISMLLAFIILFFIIQGAKRGAMVSGAIGMMFFAYYQLKTIDAKNRYKGLILVFLGIVALGVFGYKFLQQNEYLIQRLYSMASGDSSASHVI